MFETLVVGSFEKKPLLERMVEKIRKTVARESDRERQLRNKPDPQVSKTLGSKNLLALHKAMDAIEYPDSTGLFKDVIGGDAGDRTIACVRCISMETTKSDRVASRSPGKRKGEAVEGGWYQSPHVA